MAVDLTLNGTVSAAGAALSGALTGTTGTFTGNLGNAKAVFNSTGGMMVKLTNKTGAASVKGTIVSVSTGTDNAFALSALNAAGCVGVVYEADVADAAECWVVVKGIAEVLFTNNVTHGMYARIGVDADTGEEAGKAVGAAIPASSFATDAYMARFGMVLESKTAGTLAKVLLD